MIAYKSMQKKRTSSAVRPRVSKKNVRKQLVRADGAACFWLHGGLVLPSLIELEKALMEMKPAQYAHHVRADHNDFAAWVGDVLHDHACAKKLAAAKTQKAALAAVRAALKAYTK